MQPRQRIMIVEDDPSLLHSLEFTLKRQKYLVDSASDGNEAQKKIVSALREDNRFDLMITEMVLPGSSGLELIDTLLDQRIEILIIAITVYSDTHLITQLAQRGIKEILVKPFNSTELMMKISSLLR